MEQKFILAKKDDQLFIKEVAETEPGIFSLLFEEKLALEAVEDAIAKGKTELIDLVRSHNMYPSSIFANKLADGIISMFGDDPKESLRIEFNDVDALQSALNAPAPIVDEKELAEIDKILENEDDFDDEFEDS